MSSPKICCFGDSITYGTGDPNGNGYRRVLWSNIIASRPDLTPVFDGPEFSGDAPVQSNCGVFGADVTTLNGLISLNFGPGKIQPNVGIVLIGVNNAKTASGTASFPTDYPNMMDNILTLCPGIGFVVMPILPSGGNRTDVPLPVQPNIDTLNNELPGLWATMVGSGYIIEQALGTLAGPADFDPAEGAAWLHPCPPGYAKLAANWTAPTLRLLKRLGF
jgi:lysophospholipase L1-like esterase